MTVQTKCLIDNWSLEHAGQLLDSSSDIVSIPDALFINNLGGLSNYINSLLYYDEPKFLSNGFEKDWTRFSWFEKNTNLFITPLSTDSLNIDWNSADSYSDEGIKNYLTASEKLEIDLFVSPERATKISTTIDQQGRSNLSATLSKIDQQVLVENSKGWFENIQVGIDRNFKFPSLTHYIFSQASSIDDLLRVIIQIKSEGKIKRVRERIEELTSASKTAHKFQKEVDILIKQNFHETVKTDKSWSIKLTVLFLTLTKSFNLDFFKRKEHLLFLKDIIACRTEAYGLDADINRIFKRKI